MTIWEGNMIQMGRPKAKLKLTDAETRELRRLVRRKKSSQVLAFRARIVLLCAKGLTNTDVAEDLGCTRPTVGKWRRRFVERRLDGLHDEPRPGAPRRINDEQVERIVDRTLHSRPPNATHWSTREMAKALGVSRMSVARVWRAFELKPHLTETFSLSRDPLFVEKVRDVVGLYMRPPDNALVLCVDEKSQIQALDRSQPLLPMGPATVDRIAPTYHRHGTTSLFAALDIATGRVIGRCFSRHRASEFLKFLRIIDSEVPIELDVHLILDNYATHKTPSVKRWLLRHSRFHVHFIPTSSSWLNLVESWFSLLTRRKLKRANHRSTTALRRDIESFLEANNQEPRPFIWTKTADEILDNLRRYLEDVDRLRSRTSETPH